MLEVLVRLKDSKVKGINGKAVKRCGDIVVAKIAPAVWGEDEKKHFLITELDDPDLEARMVAKGVKMLTYPYAIYREEDAGPHRGKRKEVYTNSCKNINIHKHFAKAKSDIYNPHKELPKVRPDRKLHLSKSDLDDDYDQRKVIKKGIWLPQ